MSYFKVTKRPKLKGAFTVSWQMKNDEGFYLPTGYDSLDQVEAEFFEVPPQYHEWRRRVLPRTDGWFLADDDLVALDWTLKKRELEGVEPVWFRRDERTRRMTYEVRTGDPDEGHDAALIWPVRDPVEELRDALEEVTGTRFKIRPVAKIGELAK